jgi:hypothetical protein
MNARPRAAIPRQFDRGSPEVGNRPAEKSRHKKRAALSIGPAFVRRPGARKVRRALRPVEPQSNERRTP